MEYFGMSLSIIRASCQFCGVFDLPSGGVGSQDSNRKNGPFDVCLQMYSGGFQNQRLMKPREHLMDTIVMIMFGSVLCTVTALNFMELRRIRKKLETK
jgi:hypothetical protein